MGLRVSVANHAASAVAVTATSEHATYLGVNLKTPECPFYPWITLAIGAQSVVIDLGSAKAFDSVTLIHATFTSVRIEADDSTSFNSAAGLPQYDSGLLTLTRNPVSWRYHHCHRLPATQTRRYVRISIPNQTPTDGSSVYTLGGVWIGMLPAAPHDVRFEVETETLEPKKLVGPDGGAWEQEVNLDHEVAQITASRMATVGLPMGLDDELRDWAELERQWAAVGFALVSLTDGDPSQVWVMRRTVTARWKTSVPVAEAQLVLKEVIG